MAATLITLAGFSLLAAFRKDSASACVRKNGDLTLRSMTLSQPFSGKASNSASQAVPALLTRISSFGSPRDQQVVIGGDGTRPCPPSADASLTPVQTPKTASLLVRRKWP